MSFRSKVVNNAAIYLSANIINAVIPFLLLPVLTRVLSTTDYGILSMFAVMLGIFGALTGLSVHGAISIRYFQLDKDGLAGYVSTIISILVVTTTVALAVVTIFQNWLVSVSGVPADWLMVGVVLSGIQFLINIKLVILQVSGSAKKYGMFQISQSLVNALMSLFLILIVGMAWQGRVLGQAASILVFGLVAALWLRRDGLIVKPSHWRVHGKDALRFGLPLIPHAIGGWMMVAGDRFIIKEQLGVAEIGLYMASLQIGSGLLMVYEAFFKSWHPEITRVATDKNLTDRRLLVLSSYKAMGMAFLVLIFYCLAILWVYPYVVGDAFLGGELIAILIAIGAFFSACYYSTAIFISIANRNELLAINTFITGGIGLVFSFFLCGYFGLIGIAVGILVGKILAFLFCWVTANYAYPMPWFKVVR